MFCLPFFLLDASLRVHSSWAVCFIRSYLNSFLPLSHASASCSLYLVERLFFWIVSWKLFDRVSCPWSPFALRFDLNYSTLFQLKFFLVTGILRISNGEVMQLYWKSNRRFKFKFCCSFHMINCDREPHWNVP